MHKLFITELMKLVIYICCIYIFISLSQKRNELAANQFKLDSLTKIHHNKNYSMNEKLICPLYSTHLGKIF